MQCPRCGCRELKITIDQQIAVDFDEDGDHQVVDGPEGDLTWDDGSACSCTSCGHGFTVKEGEAAAAGDGQAAETGATPANASAEDAAKHLMARREQATVLAALRYWQRRAGIERKTCDIATDCGELVPLEVGEIDALCAKLNPFGSPARSPGSLFMLAIDWDSLKELSS